MTMRPGQEMEHESWARQGCHLLTAQIRQIVGTLRLCVCEARGVWRFIQQTISLREAVSSFACLCSRISVFKKKTSMLAASCGIHVQVLEAWVQGKRKKSVAPEGRRVQKCSSDRQPRKSTQKAAPSKSKQQEQSQSTLPPCRRSWRSAWQQRLACRNALRQALQSSRQALSSTC